MHEKVGSPSGPQDDRQAFQDHQDCVVMRSYLCLMSRDSACHTPPCSWDRILSHKKPFSGQAKTIRLHTQCWGIEDDQL